MTSDSRLLAATEIQLRPSWSAAACVVLATAAAVISIVSVQIHPFLASLVALAAIVLGARAALRMGRPTLVLRLEGDGFAYRHGSGWSSHVRQAFVSPWFIGWRGRGWVGFGVFRCQLGRDEFRRLARTLRQSGLP
ncbi:MAG: hypothetical protein V2J42_08885 [Wenzhouxiangella sp.]|jgi:hypothetical protein|nr:hypothetical protein [Wenzhouxiangella sp.]